jgi:acylphosphatase
MDKIGVHCFVSGKVQGVFFRRETQAKAFELDLKGWVRNTQDDRLEVMIYGEPEKVKKLTDWLETGPPHAQVSNVDKETVPYNDEGNGFKVR